MNKNFSVILTTYSSESIKNLKESLTSLLEQSLLPSNIFLVFDGQVPKKQIGLVINLEKKYKYNINKIFLKKNIGRAEARNIALSKIKDPYTAIMDSDDICHRDRFNIQINILRHNPSVDVVCSLTHEFYNTFTKKNFLSIKKCPEFNNDIKNKLSLSCCISNPTIIAKTKTLKDFGGYPDLKYLNEDYLFFLKMINNGVIFYCVQTPLVFVRISESQILRRKGLKILLHDFKFRFLIYRLGYCGIFISSIVCILLIIRRLSTKKLGYFFQQLWRKI